MNRFLSLLPRLAITLITVAVAIVVGKALWNYYIEAPWTRDGRVRADVVTIAPDVSGLVTEVLVSDNQEVKRGQVLFRIDPDRFHINQRQAEAVVAGKRATDAQMVDDYNRYLKLAGGIASEQKVEQAKASYLLARAALTQAMADLDAAKLNVARSEVRASVNGRISNFELRPGAYVAAGRGVVALVDTDTLRVEGYFEETKLGRIRVGAAARIWLLGDQNRFVEGQVESIAGAIAERDRTDSSSLLASISPTFAWVRLAQRVPVRVKLTGTADGQTLLPGRTATVSIEPPADDRPLGFGLMRW